MSPDQVLEQSPTDPRVSCPSCLGTGYLDADRTTRDPLCHGAGLIRPERLKERTKMGQVTEAAEPSHQY